MTELENPYVEATVENFRRTPASLRQGLLQRLARELNGGGSNPPGSAASFRRVPFADRSAEFQWIEKNSPLYPGEWVALSGQRLLAHSVNYDEVSRAAKASGEANAMFMFIEDEQSEDFVRFLS